MVQVLRKHVGYLTVFLLLLFLYGSMVSYIASKNAAVVVNQTRRDDTNVVILRKYQGSVVENFTHRPLVYEYKTLEDLLSLTKDYIHLFDPSAIPWRRGRCEFL